MSKLGLLGAAWLVLLAPCACSVDGTGYTFATETGDGGEIANAGETSTTAPAGGGGRASVPTGGVEGGTRPHTNGGMTSQAGVGGASSASAGRASSAGGEAGTDDAKNSSTDDVKNCGGPGHDCTRLPNVNPNAAGVECRAGQCYVPPSACASGWAHCSARPDDGCEADLKSSADCGACGQACSALTPVCGLEAGEPACTSGCAAPLPDLCGSSCVATAADPRNCGDCGHDCSALPNVLPGAAGIECRAGTCYVPQSACASGFGHCSSRADDGCEADLSRPETCGRCDQQCSAPTDLCATNTSTPTCSSSCVAPSPDLCGSSCVNLASDPANCGSCGNACGANQTCAAATKTCECVSGTRACPDGGCAAESPTSCGASCTVCPVVAHGTRQCLSGGRCDATCEPQYLRCDSQPRTCVPSTWSFESNTAEGFSVVELGPSNAVDGLSVSTARAAPRAGTHSLAVPVTFNCNRREARVDLTPCASSVPSDWRGKTLSFQVYLDGPSLFDGDKQATAQVLSETALTQNIPLSVGQWIPVSFPLTDAAAAGAYTFGFSMYMVPTGPPPGSICMQWSGTVYLDAFSLN